MYFIETERLTEEMKQKTFDHYVSQDGVNDLKLTFREVGWINYYSVDYMENEIEYLDLVVVGKISYNWGDNNRPYSGSFQYSVISIAQFS